MCFCLITKKKLKTDYKMRVLNLVEWVNSKFSGVFSHAYVGQYVQVVACALQIYAMHLWHAILVLTSLGAHRLHLFLLSPLSLAASDLPPQPCISLTGPAEAGVRGRCWKIKINIPYLGCQLRLCSSCCNPGWHWVSCPPWCSQCHPCADLWSGAHFSFSLDSRTQQCEYRWR